MSDKRQPVTCLQCHFLAKSGGYVPDAESGSSGKPFRARPIWLEVRAEERSDLLNHASSSLACDERLWSAMRGEPAEAQRELRRDRTSCEMYFGYRPGATFDAGRSLRTAQQSRDDLTRERRFTAWGIALAALAVLVSTLGTCADLAEKLGFFDRPTPTAPAAAAGGEQALPR
jgi:hypothetical protein